MPSIHEIRHGRYFGVKNKVKGKILPRPWFNIDPEPLVPKAQRIQKLLCDCISNPSLWKKNEIKLAKKLAKKGLIKITRSGSKTCGRNRYSTTEKGVLYR